MNYLGMKFKSAEEIIEWSKAGNIEHYRSLARQFSKHPSMELSSMMSDQADILIRIYNLTPEEVEELEVI